MYELDLYKIRKQTPPGLVQRLETLAVNHRKSQQKIAVFDLDNTLLIGDIGDALFAWLLLEKYPLSLSWKEYHDLLAARKKQEAYQKVVTAMAGIETQDIIETTLRLMTIGKQNGSKLTCLEIPGKPRPFIVPLPVPHPAMQHLTGLLKKLDFEVYVISASNQLSVRAVTREYFGLPDSHVFGICPTEEKKEVPGKGTVTVIGDRLLPPITIVEGKVACYRQMIGETAPLLAAGDSTSDIPMINLVQEPGIIIWVGNEMSRYKEEIQPHIHNPGSVYFFDRWSS